MAELPAQVLDHAPRNPVTLAPGALGSIEAIEAFTGTCIGLLQAPETGALVLDLGDIDPAQPAVAVPDPIPAETLGGLHRALIALADHLAAAHKPVVARLTGRVCGPAALIALAADLRVAGPSLSFGFPEAGFGLLPPGGVVARAAARVGAGAALDALLSGRLMSAREAQAAGFIDLVTSTEPAAAAIAARRLIEDGGEGLVRDPRAGLFDPDRYLAETTAWRDRAQASGDAVALAAVDCAEAALLLPEPAAAAIEAELVLALAARPEAQARLRLGQAAHRLGQVGPRPASVVLLGARPEDVPMIAGLLAEGVGVTLCDPEVERLRQALEAVAARQDHGVETGAITPEARDAAWARIAACVDPLALEPADLHLVTPLAAGWELPAPALPARALLDGAASAGDAVALPGLSWRLGSLGGGVMEVASGPDAPPETLRGLAGMGQALGLVVLRVAPDQPLPSARLRFAWWAAAADCLRLGIAGDALDATFRALGLPAGPVAAARAAGPEGLVHLAQSLDDQARARVASGGLAALWADPPADGSAEPWRDMRAARDTCLAALAQEGARLVSEQRLPGADAVDLVACHSLDLPLDLGGPMLWAERFGGRNRLLPARNLLRAMGTRIEAAFGPEAAAPWEPAPLWEQRIRSGQGF